VRICYVVADSGVPVFGNKGASVHVRELIRALGRVHDIDLFCALQGTENYQLPVQSIHQVSRPARSSSSDAALDRDLGRIAVVEAMTRMVAAAHDAASYDLIYERYSLFSTVGLSMARTYGEPFLLEVNAPLIVERRRVEPVPLAPLAEERENEIFHNADGVLCVSEAVATYVLSHGGVTGRAHVVPNAIDILRFRPDISGAEVRSRFALGAALTVGFAGSLKPWHGVDLLIKAFGQVATANWRLLIIGEGPERVRLEQLTQQLQIREQVLFAGAVHHDAIPAHVAALDIAVAPYRGSPDFYFSPLKLYEYLAMGRAVLASDVGQISAVVRHLENGYLVPPDDVTALAAGLHRLASDVELRRALGKRAPRGLASWTDVAERVVDIAQRAREAA
jgi:glycosyltransferase involved in cell wall biosynthesis